MIFNMKNYISKKMLDYQGLTFDDVLLYPDYCDFKRDDIKLETYLTKKIKIKIPFISSPMDTVTESEMAIALGKLGGIGIIHRNLTINDQVNEIIKVKKQQIIVGAAIGSGPGFEDRVDALVKNDVDVIVIDSAHGYTKSIIDTVRIIKNKYPQLQVIAGNVATYKGALALIKAGVDGLRVGMGPGAICTTRIISGMGVPQISALFETCAVAQKYKIPVISDGGIKYSGDMIKALAAGASTIMMGSIFASCQESPGEIYKLNSKQIPSRFKNILKNDQDVYLFKSYRGMGSIGAMKKGAKIKSENEFHGKSYSDRVLVAEGVEGMVPIRGKVKDILAQAIGGIKSGMYYLGTKTIKDLHDKAKFLKISQSSLKESHPHDIFVTNPGENYQF
jgi:IMP dehydrogenase